MEQHAQDYSISFTIGQLFNQLVNSLKTSGNEIDAEKAQWETTFFFVMFSDGKSKPFSEAYNDKGECIEYPDLKKIEEKQWSYLIERVDTVKNPVLKANYAHILWCSPKKHGKYAQIAIENYLLLVKIYEQKDRDCPTEHFGLKALDCLKQAYFLAIVINYRSEDIKTEFQRLMTSYNPESSSCPSLRTQLFALTLEDKKIFEKEDLAGFDKLCDEVAGIWISRDNLHAAINVYELAERWEMKNYGKNSGIWRRKVAESYESIMRRRLEKEEYAVAVSFCMDAIENYRMIKDTEKIDELGQIYQQIKNKVEFKEFSQSLDLSDHVRRCRTFAKNLMQRTPEEIIGFLATDNKYILPNVQLVREHAKKLGDEYPMSNLFPAVVTDQQGNPAQNFRTDEEREKHSILKRYQIELNLNNKFIIQEILLAGIRENKINTEIVVKFLADNSWAGKNFVKQMPNNQEITKNWIGLLAPALDEYFSQMNNYFLNNSMIPNFILCIDSLTLKIEGLLRDFSELNGIPISDVKRDGIAREKILNDFLIEEKLKTKFSDDELEFLKFLLVEQSGFNLRHRVAHSLMNFQDYNFDYMNYLFIGMLRICKYDIVQNEN
ncbi:MAG: DUF4209 domain-containing protein [Methanoregula sp.]|nr:MAG: DUF4209 domain-containing protein [Methanoregula sp.]